MASSEIKTTSTPQWSSLSHFSWEDQLEYHGKAAQRLLAWYSPEHRAWLQYDPHNAQWKGYRVVDAAPLSLLQPWHDAPWERLFDDHEAPFYQWFVGGLTNAGYVEVDLPMLDNHGQDVAFRFEGDRWDPDKNQGQGGPVDERRISRRDLFWETARRSVILKTLGLRTNDRIALNCPNIPEQIYYMEAAKRLGIIYTPVFGGFSDKTLSDRIEDSQASLVITADGGYRNAEYVPYKSQYTDPALDNYVSTAKALSILQIELKDALDPDLAAKAHGVSVERLGDDLTVAPSDVMQTLGHLINHFNLSADISYRLRRKVLDGLAQMPARVTHGVIVIRHTGHQDFVATARDHLDHDLLSEADRLLLSTAQRLGHRVKTISDLHTLGDRELVQIVWALVPPQPVEANQPLFIIYTSGSTGKPKGIVHCHGYLSQVLDTMDQVFDAQPSAGDVLYVVADPGWITGQSYMIAGALGRRIPSVITEGSPIFPHAGRFTSIIDRHQVTLFKAGSTFMKSILANPESVQLMRRYSTRHLRTATFCAEPVSPAVQSFAIDNVTPRYINSYWATEHGAIVLSVEPRATVLPDTKTYPLPYIDAWVGQAEGSDIAPVPLGVKGELVIANPFPSLFRYVWGDVQHFGEPGWRGDQDRYQQTYFRRHGDGFVYIQGDFAIAHLDGSFTLHGRSDDVINVSGHRMGTEEIEGALLKDRVHNPKSPVGNALVIGAPHPEKGLVPIALIATAPGRVLLERDIARLKGLVRQEKGAVAVPYDILAVSAFPETRSGKYVRRLVAQIFHGQPIGDTSTLKNPEVLPDIIGLAQTWRQQEQRRERPNPSLAFDGRFVTIRTTPDPYRRDARIAVCLLHNAPVNALSERVLDEILVALSEVQAAPYALSVLVMASEIPGVFVAGADIKELKDGFDDWNALHVLPRKAQAVAKALEEMPCPTVACLDGAALGGGNELAMATDLRIAHREVEIGQPEINLYINPGYGATQRLPRWLHDSAGSHGLNRALWLLLSGRTMSAEEAFQLGYIDRLVSGQALSEALTWYRSPDGKRAIESAFAHRSERLAAWRSPAPWPQDFVLDHHVQRAIAHHSHTPRETVAAAILHLVTDGWVQGLEVGLAKEANTFTQLVLSPEKGRDGITRFLEKRSLPLPTRDISQSNPEELESMGLLLPIGHPFIPGLTPIPLFQWAQGVSKDAATGLALHGDPQVSERKVIVKVPTVGPNQVLLYMLASEVNFNDIWALTGVPVSPFDLHDKDIHITGSGGAGIVAAMGSEVQREGRLALGALVTIYSGQNDVLHPDVGLDPMFAGFHIQGYDTPDGSHAQFLLADAPQVHPKPSHLTIEAAASYTLALGTVFRTLHNTLAILPGKRLFVEGGGTGTGLEAVKSAAAMGVQVTALVSDAIRGERTLTHGAHATINRRDPEFSEIFTAVPRDPAKWQDWEKAGASWVSRYRQENHGYDADYIISHAGEKMFPRSFQLLAEGGTIAFFGASTGYHFTFLAKPGASTPKAVLEQAAVKPGMGAVIFYGVDPRQVDDEMGLKAIEALRARHLDIVVITHTDDQSHFVQGLGWGDQVRGVLSLEHLRKQTQDPLEWPDGFVELPDPKEDPQAFRETIRHYNDMVVKPLGSKLSRYFRSTTNPRGYPDIIIERLGYDSLAHSVSLVRPFTGRVLYFEEMAGQRLSFYAPQLWMRQRQIIMPTASIKGTHLSNAYEVQEMNHLIELGLLEITEPVVVPFDHLANAHQAMWENRHQGAQYVANIALPELGLRTRQALFQSWGV